MTVQISASETNDELEWRLAKLAYRHRLAKTAQVRNELHDDIDQVLDELSERRMSGIRKHG